MLEINGLRVLVDFIVNTQGRVESHLILESSGEANEKVVSKTIQQWRFRPAICKGVPINAEVRVLFVARRKKLPHPVASISFGAPPLEIRVTESTGKNASQRL
jgi:TonB family protein